MIAFALRVVVDSIVSSPDGGPAILIGLSLIVGVAWWASWLLAPGSPKQRVAPEIGADADLMSLDVVPTRTTDVYSPPKPKGYPARAYAVALAMVTSRAMAGSRRVTGLLDETGLQPMAYLPSR
jgi:hypothetical protein